MTNDATKYALVLPCLVSLAPRREVARLDSNEPLLVPTENEWRGFRAYVVGVQVIIVMREALGMGVFRETVLPARWDEVGGWVVDEEPLVPSVLALVRAHRKVVRDLEVEAGLDRF
jgi:hypothetical protein